MPRTFTVICRHILTCASLALSITLVACGSGDSTTGDVLDILIPPMDVPGDPGSDAEPVDNGTDPGQTGRDLPPVDPGTDSFTDPDIPVPACDVDKDSYLSLLIQANDAWFARCRPADITDFPNRPLTRAWVLGGISRGAWPIYQSTLDAGILRVDQAAACAYFAALQAGDCNASFSMAAGLKGDAPVDGPCYVSEECPTGHFCRYGAPGVCPGACKPAVGQNASCDVDDCLAPLRCVGDSEGVYTCLPRKTIRPLGDACNPSTDECAAGYCDGQTCRKAPGPSQTCTPGTQLCSESICNRTLNICAPLVDEGGDCDLWRDCRDGMYCERFVGKCRWREGVGSTCDPSWRSFDFGISLFCQSGVCSQETGKCTEDLPDPPQCRPQ